MRIMVDFASRALGAVLNKVRFCKDPGYNSFTQFYKSCVCPKNRAISYFLTVNKMASKLSVSGDMGWESCGVRHEGDMLRLWNRLINIPDNRLTKEIFLL